MLLTQSAARRNLRRQANTEVFTYHLPGFSWLPCSSQAAVSFHVCLDSYNVWSDWRRTWPRVTTSITWSSISAKAMRCDRVQRIQRGCCCPESTNPNTHMCHMSNLAAKKVLDVQRMWKNVKYIHNLPFYFSVMVFNNRQGVCLD